MLSHIKQTDVSVPFRDGAYWYYSRTEEGLQYPIHCRRRGNPAGMDADAAEEVILDGNVLAKGQAFFAVGDTDITDDGRWLAYTTDTRVSGSTRCTSRIWRPAKRWPGKWSAWAPWFGRLTITLCSIRSKTSSRSASTSFGGTRWAQSTRKMC